MTRAAAWLVGAAALLLLGAAPPRPQRIMSLMRCNDRILLVLVPRERITSVTFLAHDAVRELMPGRDREVAVNHGSAEDVLRDRPDLILAAPYASATAKRLAAEVGARVVEIAPVNSFADVRAMTRQIGRLVGEPARAEAMVAGMDRTLAELAARPLPRRVTVAAWSGAGAVPGRGTLTDELIRVAGGTNIAARLPDTRYSTFGVEELLAARPDAILQGANAWTAASLTAARARHPLVRRLYAGRVIGMPDALTTCGLPQTARAAVDLRRRLAALPPGGVRW